MAAFSLTTAWVKVAAAGQTVEVQNSGKAKALIMTSTGAPADPGGILLVESSRVLVLTQDLYARAPDDGFLAYLVVMGGFTLPSGTTTTPPTTDSTASANLANASRSLNPLI